MIFRKRPSRADKLAAILKIVIELLGIQRCLIPDFDLDNEDGTPNGKALGYAMGFLDSALQISKLDITEDQETMMLLTVLHEFAPTKCGDYIAFLKRTATTDPAVMNGMMLGGNQYVDWCNSQGQAQWGWGRCFNRKN